jgi:hypothetical protein
MKIGFKEMLQQWRWQGRRYLGGLFHGLGFGIGFSVYLFSLNFKEYSFKMALIEKSW